METKEGCHDKRGNRAVQQVRDPIIGSVKFTATMTIKNASDDELGDKMPEFTIDDFRQEEI